ncbi:MAG: ATP-dependent zinc metalloprotease FtsH [Candidatus Microthrix parvicella]|jgi:cell division protease FtsH|uniref:ATP-dependent zinc metalloprotease FtsH n=1 Tax=Candidatus Neomicrothrix parvicella RN1 TaxID=1229780 RepID=R4Z192_9ACTN|nr:MULTISPECIES: ATP-dependent zinc metalloprotease FtsH [Microthrix]NLH66613.1 ATP-dependent zinc metalloprotease FtsH [Candidatus Microthrix parvicella]MBK6503750.1 ATP-dependent zinc metalloprotease FtsH [Candidatus Microthrix sp.]MBK7019538.1 ATP-dependent zinc metalloprotease FtsH [Candidatus Microthrix sp.]MBK7324546.1 ATP-dependent zinc metalloprotease FtsH [Candidatus Microthrix sp.]MBL0204732.1 ATP-dependent zinc metalloprotease FtsH [Candidatus Microthrix sp.]
MPAKKRRQQLIVAAGVVVVALVVTLVLIRLLGSDPKELRYDQLIDRVDSGDVEEATLHSAQGQVTGKLEDGTEFTASVTTEGSDDLARLISRSGAELKVDTAKSSWWEDLLLNVGPTVLVLGAFLYFMMNMQGGGIGGLRIGRSGSKTRTVDSQVTFADVAGADEAVAELSEIRDFLSDPDRFAAMGARIPKGVLLFGPPGTGKTLLARAVAGEAGVPFMSLSGSDFVEMFVGVGASRVRDLFKQAKADAPAIIFVDEIDAVGRHRGAGVGGGHDEREQTLNQLLVEMDGFDPTTGVILMAATNRPDILDPALLRPGRFDRQVVVDLPDLAGRLAILKVHTKGKPFADGVNLEVLARRTPGFTGADLANVVNEAAILTTREGRNEVSEADLTEAIDRVMAGPARHSRVMSEADKLTIAYHEAGHAVLGRVLDHTDPVHRVSIVARGQALGWTLSLPEEDRYLTSRAQLNDRMVMTLGGRVAEELVFGEITTGAADDIEQVTDLARRMVTEFGMSERLGPLHFGSDEPQVAGRDPHGVKLSDEVAAQVDAEISRMVTEASHRATELLGVHRGMLDRLAKRLVEQETVTGEELDGLLKDPLNNESVTDQPGGTP